MIIGLLQFEATLQAQSLKEKRFVLRSFKDRIRSKFNIAVAETAHADKWQRTEMSLVTLGNSRSVVESSLRKALAEAEQYHEWLISRTHIDFY